MKRSYILACAAAAAVSVSACDGLKEAFTAHVDVVARAGGQELSTERLANILGNAQIPIRKDVANVLADVWVSYQLLGRSAAHADSLRETKLADEAMWAMVAQMKISKFYEIVKKGFPGPDTNNLEQQYAQAEALAGQHILIMFPEGGTGMSDAKKEEIRKKADDIRKRTTSANFNAFVKQYSEDPGSKANNGTYAMFPPPQMVPEFENGVRALKPGEISPALVQTTYGYHILRRHLVSEVRSTFIDWLITNSERIASTKYIDKLQAEGKLQIKPGAGAKVKELATDPIKLQEDRTVLATSRLGNFTGASFLKWLRAHPQAQQLGEALVNRMDDSSRATWVKGFVGQELLVAEAERQKIKLDSADVARPREMFQQMVTNAWQGLKVDPTSLGDSARTVSEKERLAAARADDALEKIFTSNGVSFVDVPQQLAWALREKYSARINTAGLDRAIDRAMAIRAVKDSAAAKQQPGAPTMMPPGAPPGAPPAGRGGL